MNELEADVLVIGAGFGGSLAALVLKRLGLSPLLLERGRHPRFAIGESSTPVADLVLAQIARRYDLPRLAPLARYGSWRAAYPEVRRGLKRGFSYFQHAAGEPFPAHADHRNELLVAASSREEEADTHWLRSDVDHFFVREAQAAGVPYFDGTEITAIDEGPPWRVAARRVEQDEPLALRARLLIDAAGEGGVLARHLNIPQQTGRLFTHSRALYAHFEGVADWHELAAARGARVADYPFHADHAALHHLLADGWMYVLKFDHGVTSAGFVLDPRAYPLDASLAPADEWSRLLARYPSLAEQFAQAEPVAPAGGLRRTGRLQRLAARAAGAGWAMLPAAAGFIDPLHSSGNAHTLVGILRLAGIVERAWNHRSFAAELARYGQTVIEEVKLIDRLVHGCYAALGQFELLAAFAMWYFVAAIWSEQRLLRGEAENDAFLCAGDRLLAGRIAAAHDRLRELAARRPLAACELAQYVEDTRRAMAPYNLEGLCDPAKRNMYFHYG